MKKKIYKIIVSILLIAILLVLTGCTSKTKLSVNANVEQNSEYYIENEDFQYFYGSYYNSIPQFAKAGNGYYFVAGFKLYFFDIETKQAYPVCSKVNCDHSGSDCLAYLSPFNFLPGISIGYYDNAIYTLGYEKEGALQHNYLYQISLNDFKQRKVAYLFDSSSAMSVLYMIHRGYVYYTNDGGDMKETTATLYRVKLGNTEQGNSDEIYEFSGIGAYLAGFNAYGNYIFFKTASYEDVQGNGYKTVLNCINIHTLESRVITESEYSCFAESGKIYYEPDEKTVMCLDIETGEETLFCNIEGPCYISADSNYIYFDNRQAMYIYNDITERQINVYDKNGNYISDIIPKNPYDECYFGGDDVMIFKEVTELGVAVEQNGVEGFYVLDKSTLPDSYEFTYMTSK